MVEVVLHLVVLGEAEQVAVLRVHQVLRLHHNLVFLSLRKVSECQTRAQRMFMTAAGDQRKGTIETLTDFADSSDWERRGRQK